MKLKRVEHIAIAVPDMAATMRVFEEILGLEVEYVEDLPQYDTRIAMYPLGQTYLELLEATGPESEVQRWMDERGDGLYHLCFEVDDIEGALRELKGKGVALLDGQPRVGHAGTKIAFLDPRSTSNVLVELVEHPVQNGGPHT